jgi:hypothetical protein
MHPLQGKGVGVGVCVQRGVAPEFQYVSARLYKS